MAATTKGTGLLSGLNERQQEAVTAPDGPVLVIAGPGSGKTRVIVTRIAHLVESGRAEAGRIAAITFTRKAAAEMERRLRSTLARQAAEEVWISTFHRLSIGILRRHGAGSGIAPDFTIADEAEQVTAMRQAMFDHDVDIRVWKPHAMVQRVSVLKNRMKDAGNSESWDEDGHRERNAALARAYQKELRERNRLDFDDLLIGAVWTLHEQEAARRATAERYRHVLVDEGQDTNVPQYLLMRLIAREHRSVFVVGDPDQAIYGWRGAELRNILEFEQDFPETRRIELDVAYRSSAHLLEAAQAMIRHNRKRIEHPLRPEQGAGAKPGFHLAADAAGEAEFAVERARARIERDQGTVAVLYRTNAQSRAFERAFKQAGVGYRVTGGQSFYERSEVLDTLACLQIGIDPTADDAAARRFVELPPHRQAGRKAVAAIERHGGSSFWERAERAAREGGLPAWHTRGIRHRFELARDAGAFVRAMPLDEALEAIVASNGYLPALERSGDEDAAERAENVWELVADAASFGNDHGDDDRHATAAAFIAQCRAMTAGNEDDETAVTLSTLHRAKGLEFDTVLLAGMTAEQLPSKRAMSAPDRSPEAVLEEERRLAYVGMTRARSELYLTAPRMVGRGRRRRAVEPSPLVNEIPEELLTSAAEAEAPAARAPEPVMRDGMRMGPYGPEVGL